MRDVPCQTTTWYPVVGYPVIKCTILYAPWCCVQTVSLSHGSWFIQRLLYYQTNKRSTLVEEYRSSIGLIQVTSKVDYVGRL